MLDQRAGDRLSAADDSSQSPDVLAEFDALTEALHDPTISVAARVTALMQLNDITGDLSGQTQTNYYRANGAGLMAAGVSLLEKSETLFAQDPAAAMAPATALATLLEQMHAATLSSASPLSADDLAGLRRVLDTAPGAEATGLRDIVERIAPSAQTAQASAPVRTPLEDRESSSEGPAEVEETRRRARSALAIVHRQEVEREHPHMPDMAQDAGSRASTTSSSELPFGPPSRDSADGGSAEVEHAAAFRLPEAETDKAKQERIASRLEQGGGVPAQAAPPPPTAAAGEALPDAGNHTPVLRQGVLDQAGTGGVEQLAPSQARVADGRKIPDVDAVRDRSHLGGQQDEAEAAGVSKRHPPAIERRAYTARTQATMRRVLEETGYFVPSLDSEEATQEDNIEMLKQAVDAHRANFDAVAAEPGADPERMVAFRTDGRFDPEKLLKQGFFPCSESDSFREVRNMRTGRSIIGSATMRANMRVYDTWEVEHGGALYQYAFNLEDIDVASWVDGDGAASSGNVGPRHDIDGMDEVHFPSVSADRVFLLDSTDADAHRLIGELAGSSHANQRFGIPLQTFVAYRHWSRTADYRELADSRGENPALRWAGIPDQAEPVFVEPGPSTHDRTAEWLSDVPLPAVRQQATPSHGSANEPARLQRSEARNATLQRILQPEVPHVPLLTDSETAMPGRPEPLQQPAASGTAGAAAPSLPAAALDAAQTRDLLLQLAQPVDEPNRPGQVVAIARLLNAVSSLPIADRMDILLHPPVAAQLTGMAAREALYPMAGPEGAGNALPLSTMVAGSLRVPIQQALRQGQTERVLAAVGHTPGAHSHGYHTALGQLARGRGLQSLDPLVNLLYGELVKDPALGAAMRAQRVPSDAGGEVPLHRLLTSPPVIGHYPPAEPGASGGTRHPAVRAATSMAGALAMIESNASALTEQAQRAKVSMQQSAQAQAHRESRQQARQAYTAAVSQQHLENLRTTNSAYDDRRERSYKEMRDHSAALRSEESDRKSLVQAKAKDAAIAQTREDSFHAGQVANAQGRQRTREVTEQRQRANQPAVLPRAAGSTSGIPAGGHTALGAATPARLTDASVVPTAVAVRGHGQTAHGATGMRLEVPQGSYMAADGHLMIPATMRYEGATIPGHFELGLARQEPLPTLVVGAPLPTRPVLDAVTGQPSPLQDASSSTPAPQRQPLTFSPNDIGQHPGGISVTLNAGRPDQMVALLPRTSFQDLRFRFNEGHIELQHAPPAPRLEQGRGGMDR